MIPKISAFYLYVRMLMCVVFGTLLMGLATTDDGDITMHQQKGLETTQQVVTHLMETNKTHEHSLEPEGLPHT